MCAQCLLLLVVPAAAQRKPAARPVELEALVVDARAVPAEYAADVLLRLVESGKVTERAWQRALLEEAFRTAGGAQNAIKRRIAPGLTYAYTREDYEARAYQLNLDTMSLRLRAVNALLKVDKRKARELFTELPTKPALAPLSCDDALVYDVSDFYETLTKIARETFSAEERARGEDVQFVLPYFADAQTYAQIWPLARVALAFDDSAARFGPIMHAYSVALGKLEADDRSFASGPDLNLFQIADLSAACARANVAPDELLAAYRAYLVRHLRARRCADTATGARQASALRSTLDYLNHELHEADPGAETLTPVRADEIKPAALAGAAKLTPYFTTPTTQSLFTTAQESRFGLADEPQTEAARRDPKRAQKLSDWLNAMSDWRGQGEASEADYFIQKCVLYQLLLEVWPTEGPARDALLQEYVAFLRQPARQQEARAGWLLHVQNLLNSRRYAAASERARLFAALNNSGEPVLRLYAALAAARAQKEANAR